MNRVVLWSPVLLAMTLSPASLQTTSCNATGDARLASLELEANGINRIVGFEPNVPNYNVWFWGATEATIRAQTVDPNSTIRWSYGGDSIPIGVGSGEVTIPVDPRAETLFVLVGAPGGAFRNYRLHLNPPCSPGDCDDANDCSADACDAETSRCVFTSIPGNPCADGVECTQDICDSSLPGVCHNPPEPDFAPCSAGGSCLGGSCAIVDIFPESAPLTVACSSNLGVGPPVFFYTELTVDYRPIVGHEALALFEATGTMSIPEPMLDAVQPAVSGGVLQADLQGLTLTVRARSGAVGPTMELGVILPPGTCLLDGASCDPANDDGSGGNSDCQPQGNFNPCQRLVTIPTSTDPAICASLDPPGCTVGVDCTKTDQYNLNGFCVTGGLPLPLRHEAEVFKLGASGETILFGWEDALTATGAALSPDGTYSLPPVSFADPIAPNGIRFIAGGLPIALQCIMAVDSNGPYGVGVPDGASPTPDSLLVGSGVWVIP